MRVVVAGATGLIGSRLVAGLRDHGAEAVPVSRGHGVDVVTGAGLAEAVRGAEVVVDVTEAPSRTEAASVRFFEAATTRLLRAAATAGAEHYVVLSVVGAERLTSGYFRAKRMQEDRVRRSPLPHSVVRATTFFETVESLALMGAYGDGVHVAPVLTRPVSTDDVATAVAGVAVGQALSGALEIAGPEEHRLDELTAKLLATWGDPRSVVADACAPLFGAKVGERTLLPGAATLVGHETFAQWLSRR